MRACAWGWSVQIQRVRGCPAVKAVLDAHTHVGAFLVKGLDETVMDLDGALDQLRLAHNIDGFQTETQSLQLLLILGQVHRADEGGRYHRGGEVCRALLRNGFRDKALGRGFGERRLLVGNVKLGKWLVDLQVLSIVVLLLCLLFFLLLLLQDVVGNITEIKLGLKVKISKVIVGKQLIIIKIIVSIVSCNKMYKIYLMNASPELV